MKKINLLFATSLVAIGATSCGAKNQTFADLVVFSPMYTAEEANNYEAEAFAVKDGKYIFVGSKEEAQKYVKEGVTNVIDRKNGLVIPGATEGHGHFLGLDSLARLLPGYNVNYEGLKQLLIDELKNIKGNHEYFVSWGLPFIDFANTMDPTKSYAFEMEQVMKDNLPEGVKDIPVIFIDGSGHQALCNITALEQAGLYDRKTNKITEIRGGSVSLTKPIDGSDPVPNGIINDELIFYVLQKTVDFTKLGATVLKDATKNAVRVLNERGFTNYLDAYMNIFAGSTFYRYTKQVDEAGELTANIAGCYTVRSFDADRKIEEIEYAKNLADQYHSDHFNPYNIKIFVDGVFETYTGWEKVAYPIFSEDDPARFGNKIWSQEELNTLVYESNKRNINVHAHSFGDAACEAMINAYLNSNAQLNKKNRNSLGHVRNIQDNDIIRCAENGIGIAANMIWHCMNNEPYNSLEEYEAAMAAISALYPEGYFQKGYPIKSLIDKGVTVSSSTDAPAAESIVGNIFNIIEVSTTGKDPGHKAFAPYNPSESVDVKTALKCMTINGAKNLGIDDKCGSIKVGKSADFVVIDKNFLHYTEDKDLRTIHDSKIENVYFEGKCVL